MTSDSQNDSLLIASEEPRTQRHEQERRSEHAGDVDGDREGGKHLALVSLYRFIGCPTHHIPFATEFVVCIAGGRPFGVSVPGYFGYLPDISFAVEGNRILLQLQADVNGV